MAQIYLYIFIRLHARHGEFPHIHEQRCSSACRLMSDSGFQNWDFCESWCLEGEHHAQVSSC